MSTFSPNAKINMMLMAVGMMAALENMDGTRPLNVVPRLNIASQQPEVDVLRELRFAEG